MPLRLSLPPDDGCGSRQGLRTTYRGLHRNSLPRQGPELAPHQPPQLLRQCSRAGLPAPPFPGPPLPAAELAEKRALAGSSPQRPAPTPGARRGAVPPWSLGQHSFTRWQGQLSQRLRRPAQA